MHPAYPRKWLMTKRQVLRPNKASTMDFIRDWNILEADFRREYGINLVEARLSWRAFLVLTNGISKDSIWTMVYKGRNSGEVAIEDDKVAERMFNRF
jgi:hypothetical protein